MLVLLGMGWCRLGCLELTVQQGHEDFVIRQVVEIPGLTSESSRCGWYYRYSGPSLFLWDKMGCRYWLENEMLNRKPWRQEAARARGLCGDVVLTSIH